MENHAIPIRRTPSLITTRSHRKRSLVELNGKLRPNYIHDMSQLLVQSYSEIGVFPHRYYNYEAPSTLVNEESYVVSPENEFQVRSELEIMDLRGLGIADLEFDKKGIYLASVTRKGCLTVHDFKSLYCSGEVEKQLLHTSVSGGISAVCWNPAKQNEVACTLSSKNEVCIFDLQYIPSEPTKVLQKLPTISVDGGIFRVHEGLLDISVFNDGARVLASDTRGTISIWDRRASDFPQTKLRTNPNSFLTSIQLKEDQFVYGASKDGFIHIWDLRGGRSSSAFKSHNEINSSPPISIKLASLLNKYGPLEGYTNIIPEGIHSIGINPSCPYQLGFHLDDGWSGVLDMHNSQVTHIHRPPPLWGGPNALLPILFRRKPSWLREHSIYAVGSAFSQGLYLLDFFPNTSSACHVDYDDSKSSTETFQSKQNRYVQLSGNVTACATHPLNGDIVAGTMEASILMISQKRRSFKKEDDDDVEH